MDVAVMLAFTFGNQQYKNILRVMQLLGLSNLPKSGWHQPSIGVSLVFYGWGGIGACPSLAAKGQCDRLFAVY
jgi:hypothetical protein